MSREPIDSTRASGDDVTVRLDQLRGHQRRPAPPETSPSPAGGGGLFSRPLPKWVWPVAAGVGLLLALLLPLLFYSQPGFTVVVRGAPPNTRLFVDDVPRGIPGIENAGDNVAGLINAHGLKAGITHAVRVNCGGTAAALYLDNGSSVNTVLAEDGEVINLTVKDKNCGAPQPVGLPAEIEYKGKMRLVNAGRFLMGDDQGKPNERPAHLVDLNDYYIDKFEVTNEQYKQFFNSSSGRAFPKEPAWDPNYSSKLDNPVAGVSWDDARSYCEWAGKRLPSEQEWEKAASWNPQAKGNDTSPSWKRYWPWGNQFNPNLANFDSGRAKAVGQFETGTSAYGVHDLAGNIGEWVNDDYRPYPGNSTPDPDYGNGDRVLRGGTFKEGVDRNDLRTTRRGHATSTIGQGETVGVRTFTYFIGFRCAMSSNDPGWREYFRGTGSQ